MKEGATMSKDSAKEEKNATLDITNIFDDIIKDGYKSEEEEILPGFKVKLRPLSYNEMYRAEAEISHRNPGVPDDVTVKLRCGKILSFAIISLNGSLIDDPNDAEATESRRIFLYDKLVTSPTIFIQKAYDLYLKAVRAENEFYAAPQEINDEIENFLKRREDK